MKPYYQDNHITIYNKDCRDMNELPNNSVQCVVTSPPYWGLRKYSGEQELIWGDNECEHHWVDKNIQAYKSDGGVHWQRARAIEAITGKNHGSIPDAYEQWADRKRGLATVGFCSLCGAWKGAYGLEPTPEMYIEHTIQILREIRRVLRKDGVVFWNIGDSYASGSGGYDDKYLARSGISRPSLKTKTLKGISSLKHPTLKPKDLCLIPFRLAIVCQEDGWWVRSVIIWSKPNPMPESVTDRPTESHEYILMLTKSARYYWDADAVREEYTEPMNRWGGDTLKANGDSMWDKGTGQSTYRDRNMRPDPAGRNIRSVWEFPTQPYPEAHFAVFPGKLPEICIKAATPEVGCCSKCGAPWERIRKPTKEYERSLERLRRVKDRFPRPAGDWHSQHAEDDNQVAQYETIGWQPTCKCNADKVPSIVLDPFLGAGTVAWVAKKLNRRAVGYELSEEYCELAVERNRQQVFG